METPILDTKAALDLILKGQTEQALRAEQQAAEQALRAEQQAAQIQHLEMVVMAELGEVKKKLNTIERNTISILGAVITDFAGMTDQTHEELQALADTITEEDAAQIVQFTEQEEIKTVVVPAPASAKTSTVTKQIKTKPVKTATVLRKWEPEASHGQKTAFGNFVNGILSKAFNCTTKGRLHPKLDDLVYLLAGYYVLERDSIRMY
jgi:hypothetical protein